VSQPAIARTAKAGGVDNPLNAPNIGLSIRKWPSVVRNVSGKGNAERVKAPVATRPRSGAVIDARTAHATKLVEQLDADHGQDLFGLARRSGLNDDEAEDAVQEALFRLWLEIRSGVDILEPRAWTFRTLYRIAMDKHRLRRRATDLVSRLRAGFRFATQSDDAERLSIWLAVDRLPSRQRQVLYLRYKADLSFDQVAAVMGINASTARAHAAFATDKLRELLETER
jgi:RNA polymerase sigma factor (sigma-70 family)